MDYKTGYTKGLEEAKEIPKPNQITIGEINA